MISIDTNRFLFFSSKASEVSLKSEAVRSLCGAMPWSPISSSSMNIEAVCFATFLFRSDREDVNVDGVKPSTLPTVLKWPAEKPPVNAP